MVGGEKVENLLENRLFELESSFHFGVVVSFDSPVLSGVDLLEEIHDFVIEEENTNCFRGSLDFPVSIVEFKCNSD